MCKEEIFEYIVRKYVEKRQYFLEKEWFTTKSSWKRTRGENEEFTRLRRADIENQKDFERWLKSYISEQSFDLHAIKEYLAYLDNHCNRLKYRVSALEVILGVFGMIAGYKIISLTLPQYKELTLAAIFFVLGMLIYGEQLKLKEYESTYREVIVLLKKIRDEKEAL